MSHISVSDDSIAFQLVKSRDHQDGEESLGPWNVYTNPKEPCVCAHLALARYLLTFPEQLRDNYSRY